MHVRRLGFCITTSWLLALGVAASACDDGNEQEPSKADATKVAAGNVEAKSDDAADANKGEKEAAKPTTALEPDRDLAKDEDAAGGDGVDEGTGGASEGGDAGGAEPEPRGEAPKTGSNAKPKTGKEPKQPEKGNGGGAAASADGKDLFKKKCASCHGPSGKADTKLGQKHDIPDWTTGGWKAKWPLAKVKNVVTNGEPGTKMKAFKDKLSAEEIDAVSKYALSLGK